MSDDIFNLTRARTLLYDCIESLNKTYENAQIQQEILQICLEIKHSKDEITHLQEKLEKEKRNHD